MTDSEIAAPEWRAPAVFFCFDLLRHAGRNLRGLTYVQRRDILADVVRPGAHVQLVHSDDDGIAQAPLRRQRLRRSDARTICEYLLSEHPAAITTEWDARKRTGKVFLDFNMNVRGKSIIAPYGPRGLAGAPVSMPLTWRELADAEPLQFRIPTLMAAARRKDPWSAALERKQSLEAKLSAMIAGAP